MGFLGVLIIRPAFIRLNCLAGCFLGLVDFVFIRPSYGKAGKSAMVADGRRQRDDSQTTPKRNRLPVPLQLFLEAPLIEPLLESNREEPFFLCCIIRSVQVPLDRS